MSGCFYNLRSSIDVSVAHLHKHRHVGLSGPLIFVALIFLLRLLRNLHLALRKCFAPTHATQSLRNLRAAKTFRARFATLPRPPPHRRRNRGGLRAVRKPNSRTEQTVLCLASPQLSRLQHFSGFFSSICQPSSLPKLLASLESYLCVHARPTLGISHECLQSRLLQSILSLKSQLAAN